MFEVRVLFVRTNIKRQNVWFVLVCLVALVSNMYSQYTCTQFQVLLFKQVNLCIGGHLGIAWTKGPL